MADAPKRTILVTGGAGFIGSNFVRFILKRVQDVRVVNLDALTYSGNLANLSDVLSVPRHTFVKGSINDAHLIADLIDAHAVEGIINFAAESHVDRSIDSPAIFVETNVAGTQALLAAAHEARVSRFVQISTDEVYGSLGPEGMFREDTPVQPNSPYSASKAAADHFVHAYRHTYGLNTIVTRCSNNYGPYQFPEKMIPLMIHNALTGKPLPVYGDGLHVRDWLYVADHCRAVWEVYEKGTAGNVYNIGGNNEHTNLDVVRTILRCLNKPESLIQFVKDRPGHDRRYAIDASRIRRDIGWEPSIDFETGIKRTVEWYCEHREWLQTIVSGDYQKYYDRMYSGREMTA
ncbi:MAG: dTDP-glucose 4,6-dehydratase [Candidatus Pacebacteria bacterium]|nr:dTDP-glucose 4,6-dehydratase [Candidatus Paceibacterota bacterium]